MTKKKDFPILSLRNLRKYYGGLKAVDDVSFDVAAHGITGLIGPNGAGKTTVFNLISGTRTLDSGEIYFKGKRIDNLPLHQTFLKGLCRTFQISRELKMMTVLENLMLVPPNQEGEKLWRTWFFPR
nr:ATP-binding cassette domain-containing protein [Spirochaeta sp.]